MPNGVQRISDLLSAPMEAVIIAVAVGIARAQRELDVNAIETQREINEDPTLSEFGLQATWYQMPRVELDMTMAIAMEEQTPSAVKPPAALQKYRLHQLHLQPVNAAYTNRFNYDVKASSTLKLTIVPVPPPAAENAVTPRLTRDEVTAIIQPLLAAETGARLAINFNGQGRVWFVLRYRLTDDSIQRLDLIVVDDETGQVVKHVKGS